MNSSPPDDAQAMADLEKAIELDPKNARAYFYRGDLNRSIPSLLPILLDRALADFSKAIDFDPTLARAHMARGMIYAHNDEHALAKADFAKIIELDWKLVDGIKAFFPKYLDEIEDERRANPR